MSAIKHYNSVRHRTWAEKVMHRDKYLCQDCARFGRRTPATTAHHIKPLQDFPELAYDLGNGIALCAACHGKRHPEKGGRRI